MRVNKLPVVIVSRLKPSQGIAAWLECFPEKPCWCRNEQVCKGRKCKAF